MTRRQGEKVMVAFGKLRQRPVALVELVEIEPVEAPVAPSIAHHLTSRNIILLDDV